MTGALGLTAGLGLVFAGLGLLPQVRGVLLGSIGVIAILCGSAVINRR